MHKNYKIQAPVEINYTLIYENDTNYTMALRFDSNFKTPTHHCHTFDTCVPAGPDVLAKQARTKNFEFKATDIKSAEYTALRIIQHILGCIINRTTKIINANNHNRGISTDSPLLLNSELPEPSLIYYEDISAWHDFSIIGFTHNTNELGIQIKVPVEPCAEMNENKPFTIFFETLYKQNENKSYSGVLAACESIRNFKQATIDTLNQISNLLDNLE